MGSKYLLVLLLFSFSCSFQKNETSKVSVDTIYDFEVLYRFQGEENFNDDKYRYKISPDSLYFIVESEFKNDRIIINSHKKEIFSEIVNTEPSSGIAKEIIIGGFKNGDNITIRINSGQPITFSLLKKEHNIIGIRKAEDKVSILFYKKVPAFY